MQQTQADIRIKNNQAKIISYLEAGLDFKSACISAGIDESTGHRWKRKSASFASQVEAGIAKYTEKLIKCVNQAALRDGKIALQVLKIRCPEVWDPSKRVRVIDSQEELKRIEDLIYG